MQAKRSLPILALLMLATLTFTPLVAASPISPNDNNSVAQSGPATLDQPCGGGPDGCVFPDMQAGETILVIATDVPVASITDTFGDHFTPVGGEAPLPGSTYVLQAFVTTVSQSGKDILTLTGTGNFPQLTAWSIFGATGVDGVSTGSGNSATPEVASFAPLKGTLLFVHSLIQYNEHDVSSPFISVELGYVMLDGSGGSSGSAYSDARGLGTGNLTTSQFLLAFPADWAEVSVAFYPPSTAILTPEFGAPTILVAAMGMVLLALMKKTKILKL